ncbi:MAG: nucleoside hydrolase [Clostridiales bacterium]|nr:nucleoside hydrolase [Clostridiales bacterium]
MQYILDAIKSKDRKKIILDTDAYNEVDDQFAIAYAMLAPETIELLSINAAPFLNSRSQSPKEGMEKSYDEIFNIINLVDPTRKIPVFKGSEHFLQNKTTPAESEAADNIINTVRSSKEKIFVVAIGAITNVASAIIKDPDIINNMVVIWLGGHALHHEHTREFNLYQDVDAAKVVFDSRVPLSVIPCAGVCDYLTTTIPELEYYLAGKNKLCDYLFDIVKNYTNNPYCWSKTLWDVSAIALLDLPESMNAVVIPTPILTGEGYFARDDGRHPFIYIRRLDRDKIFGRLFEKLTAL